MVMMIILNQNVLRTIHLNLMLVVVRADVIQVEFIDHQIGMDSKLLNLYVVLYCVCVLHILREEECSVLLCFVM